MDVPLSEGGLSEPAAQLRDEFSALAYQIRDMPDHDAIALASSGAHDLVVLLAGFHDRSSNARAALREISVLCQSALMGAH